MGQALQADRFPAVHDPETMAARVMEFAPATDSEALKLASHAYVLENGRITLAGSGQALLNDDRVRQAYLGL